MGSRGDSTAATVTSSVGSSSSSFTTAPTQVHWHLKLPRKSNRMAHADPYADIDFDEITEQTGLAGDEIKCLKVCFDLFDTKKVEFLSADDLGEIMRAMGFRPTEEELKELLLEIDKEGLGYITTETLRGLIGELLAPLTEEELEGILEELDEDGSGSMDFDEFCEMMMTKPE